MHLNSDQLNKLCAIAIEAALEAGEFISTYTNKPIRVELKESHPTNNNRVAGGSTLASQVVTEVDIQSQERILKHLSPTLALYDLGMLSEESVDDSSRFDKDYFWCVDPLDGTLPFTEGQPGYAVSIALVSNNGEAIIGVIYDPVQKNIYHAIKDQGAFKNNEPIVVHHCTNTFSFITDRSFIKLDRFAKIKDSLHQYSTTIGCNHLKTITHGGAAMNAIWVLENNPACYFKMPKASIGGGSLWDFAATACIFKQLGLICTDFQGNTLHLNKKESTFMNQEGVIYAYDKTTSKFIQLLQSTT